MKNKVKLIFAFLLFGMLLSGNLQSEAQSANRRSLMALPPARTAVLSPTYLPPVSTSSVDIDICDMPFTRSAGGWSTADPNWSGAPSAPSDATAYQPSYPMYEPASTCPAYSTCTPSVYSCPASSCVSIGGCGSSIGCGSISGCDGGSFYSGVSCPSSCATSCPWSLGGL